MRTLAASVVLIVASCTITSGPSPVSAQAALDQWAAFMADKPADAIVFVRELTQGGGWNGPNANDAKIAFMNGAIQATGTLDDMEPAPTEVAWKDGTRQAVSLVSATSAFAAMVAELKASCVACDETAQLHVTGADLTIREAVTSHGNASVPVWQFTFASGEEPIDPISYVAVKDRVGPQDWPHWRDHASFTDSAYATAADARITIAFLGGACDASHSIVAVESALAVVPIITTVVRPGACTAQGILYGLELQLASPLGNRVVLDAGSGFPVPVYPEEPPALQPG